MPIVVTCARCGQNMVRHGANSWACKDCGENPAPDPPCESCAGLRAAIKKHHDQKADDRCWLDDAELYAAAGLPPADVTVGDQSAMLQNCKRFVAQRCAPGGGWKSYAELEREVAGLVGVLSAAACAIRDGRGPTCLDMIARKLAEHGGGVTEKAG